MIDNLKPKIMPIGVVLVPDSYAWMTEATVLPDTRWFGIILLDSWLDTVLWASLGVVLIFSLIFLLLQTYFFIVSFFGWWDDWGN